MRSINTSVLSKVSFNHTKKVKLIQTTKENGSTGLDYRQTLAGLTDDQVNKLAELKSEEMDMFGYTFDKGPVQKRASTVD